MKIARLQLDSGSTCYAQPADDGSFTRLDGDLFSGLTATSDSVSGKLLAPVMPVDILCIGLNYRKHAEEGGAAIPEHPVLFMKLRRPERGDPPRA